MIIDSLETLVADYRGRNQKDPELILINSEDAERLRMEVIRKKGLEAEADVGFYGQARIIRSNDVYPGEYRLI